MTLTAFIKALDDYYGAYRPAVMAAVVLHLQGLPRDALTALYDAVTSDYTGSYGKVPDRAAILTIQREHDLMGPPQNGDHPDEFGNVWCWYGGKRLGHRDGGRLIPDMSLVPEGKLSEYFKSWAELSSPAAFAKFIEGAEQLSLPAP